MRIASGRTDQKIAFVAVDSADLKTRKTGLSSFTVYRSRNGGTATAYTTPTIAELDATNMPGVYVLTVDEDTTITSGVDEEEYVVHITQATMAPVTRAITLFRPKITEGQTVAAGSSKIDAQVKAIDANAITATSINADAITAAKVADGTIDAATFAAGAINAAAIATDAITAAKIADGAIDAATFAAGAIDAAAIATDAIGSAELAASAVTKIANGLPTEATITDAVWDELQSLHTGAGTFGENLDAPVSGASAPSAAAVADAVWDEATSGHVAAGSFGQAAQAAIIRAGTAQAGAAGSITLDAGASGTNDLYNGCIVIIIGGTGAGQARAIIDYVGGTQVASIVPNWITNPDNTSAFAILPLARVDLHQWKGVTPANLQSGGVVAFVQEFLADVITSSALAASATAEIADAVWDEARSGHTADGSFGQGVQAPIIRTGTLQTGGSANVKLDAGASTIDGFYNDCVIVIVAGTGAGQARRINDYVGSTLIASVDPPFPTTTSTDSVFVILAAGMADVGAWDGDQNAVAVAASYPAVTPFAITTAVGNKIADFILRRSLATAEGSSDGDTYGFRSLAGAISKLVNRVKLNTGTAKLEVYKTDDTTKLADQSATQAVENPITELNTD